MTKEQIELQALRMEGFKEGYIAALMWMSNQLPKPEIPNATEKN